MPLTPKTDEYHIIKNIKYFGNDNPVCPFCDKEINISEHERYDLYEEDCHEIECPYCEKEIYVNTSVKYTFDTSDQSD